MDRVWKSGANGAPPALDNASTGYATAGNPGTGTPATKPGPHWFHSVTEEILSVLTEAAITFDKTVVTQLRDAIRKVSGTGIQTTTSTGSQNNFALTTGYRHLILRCNNASLLTLTGFVAGSDGDQIEIISIGAGQVDITNQDTNSTAANRTINQVTGTISLAAGSGVARLRYDGTTQRWRVVYHEQGAWIVPTFAAGDYTGSGSMTWTVESGDVAIAAYLLRGRTLQVALTIRTSTVGGTPSTALQRVIPGGFTAARQHEGPFNVNDNGTYRPGIWQTPAAGTLIKYLIASGGPNYAASTNQTDIVSEVVLDVQ